MAISNLTNTKWILNDDWTATRGYGNFSVNITYNNNNYTTFYIGYNPGLGGNEANVIGFNDGTHIFSGEVIELTITGGTDVTNASLISWLTSNATQVVEPEYTLRIDGVEVTDYENVVINGVSYKCSSKQLGVIYMERGLTFEITHTYNFEIGMTWEEFLNSSYNDGNFGISSEANSNGKYELIAFLNLDLEPGSVNGTLLGTIKLSDLIDNERTYVYGSHGGGSND